MDQLKLKVRHYGRKQLHKENCPMDPFELVQCWLKEALNEEVFEPNAMTLATVDALGQPSARIVLLKELTNRHLIFYTNYDSQKSQNMAANPKIAATFWWPSSERQLRIEGVISKVSSEQSTAYFASRGTDSKLGAHASAQSSVIENRTILDDEFKTLQKNFENKSNIPRPKNWGGFAIKPHKIEFWQGGPNRLHDRILYELSSRDVWNLCRLAP